MGKTAIISKEQARRAAATLAAISAGEITGEGTPTRCTAAFRLANLYQQQERYNLDQKTPEDFERQLAAKPSQNVRELAALTPESLADLQRTMTADFPRKRRSA